MDNFLAYNVAHLDSEFFDICLQYEYNIYLDNMKLIDIGILLATLFSLSTSRTYSYSPELKTTTFYTCYFQSGSDRVIIDLNIMKLKSKITIL